MDDVPRPRASQLQVKFVTKQEQYAVPDIPFSLPAEIDPNGLNQLLNKLLSDNSREFRDIIDGVAFDFLVFGKLLRLPLEEFLQEENVSLENTVEVEYILRTPSPQPEDALLHQDWIAGVHVADKWVLTGCYDASVNIWTTKGVHKVSAKEHTNVIKAVSWLKPDDPSRGFITVSHDLTAILWQWEPGASAPEMVSVLRGHERGIDSVGVNQEATRIATGGWDTQLKIWSADTLNADGSNTDEPPRKKSKGGVLTQTPLNTLSGHKESISRVLWMDNQTVCTASMDHTIKIWDAELCGIKHEIVGQKANLGASWSPLANALLVSSADRHIRLYDPRSAEGAVCKATYTSHKLWVSCVAWSQYEPHLFMSGGYDQCVKLWDTRSPNVPLFDLTGHEGRVLCVDWSNPKHLVSGGTDNSVHIFKNLHLNG